MAKFPFVIDGIIYGGRIKGWLTKRTASLTAIAHERFGKDGIIEMKFSKGLGQVLLKELEHYYNTSTGGGKALGGWVENSEVIYRNPKGKPFEEFFGKKAVRGLKIKIVIDVP